MANSLYYFSCTFAGRPSEIKVALQCSPYGRCRRGSGAIPAGWSPEFAGGGWGEGLGATRGLFGSSVDGERLPVGGAPAASGGGRRGCPAGEVGARGGLCTGR
jgi:hypothetical protein